MGQVVRDSVLHNEGAIWKLDSVLRFSQERPPGRDQTEPVADGFGSYSGSARGRASYGGLMACNGSAPGDASYGGSRLTLDVINALRYYRFE